VSEANEVEGQSARPRLADERSLEMLDFNAIRRMLAGHAATDRAAEQARRLVPLTGIERVRGEQAATREMRSVVAADPFDLPRGVEGADAVGRENQVHQDVRLADLGDRRGQPANRRPDA